MYHSLNSKCLEDPNLKINRIHIVASNIIDQYSIQHILHNHLPPSTLLNSKFSLSNPVSVFSSNPPFSYPSNHSVIRTIVLSYNIMI